MICEIKKNHLSGNSKRFKKNKYNLIMHQIIKFVKREKLFSKIFFLLSAILVFGAIGGLENGYINCLQAMALEIIGFVIMFASGKRINIFYKKEDFER